LKGKAVRGSFSKDEIPKSVKSGSSNFGKSGVFISFCASKQLLTVDSF
jgi:hypothetical protein